MRYGIIILLIFLATHLYAQPKDTRAEVKVKGRVNEISVAPDGKIWLVTALGKIYYTNNIDSNWHYSMPLFIEDDNFLDHPSLDRISFFNNDTAIITGYISTDNDNLKKNGFYYTKDGGKSWKLCNYNGDEWIYDAFVQRTGNAWIGGSSGEIFFSKNFGQKWTKLNSPYNSSSRMSSIFMRNSNEGISGALGNNIYTTSNNWNSYKKIPTPLDQKKYVSKEGSADARINKIVLWNNYLVVNQDGNIFYTDSHNIQWKKFPVSIISFSFDDKSNTLFAITDNLKIISFFSPGKFIFVSNRSLASPPINIKAINGALFVIDNFYDIYKIDSKIFKQNSLFTTDHKIQDLDVTKEFGNLMWAASGNNLYLAEKNDQNDYDWYREHILNFPVANITPINDYEAVLLDMSNNNHLYSIKKHSVVPYYPQRPLDKFIQYPIISVLIKAGSDGCFHSLANSIVYQKSDKTTLSTKEFSFGKPPDISNTAFINKANSDILIDILSSINSEPSFVPSIHDFDITEKDKKNYFDIVDKITENGSPISFDQINNKDVYLNVFRNIDTLKSGLLQKILDDGEGMSSTTTNWFNIEIINQHNDTLNINSKYYEHNPPWNLPWVFEYNGITFNCYNLKFSKFINDCIPREFMQKESFDNSLLIMKIAHYFDEQK